MTFSQCPALDSSTMSLRDSALGVQSVLGRSYDSINLPNYKVILSRLRWTPSVTLQSYSTALVEFPRVSTTSLFSGDLSSLLRKLRSSRASIFIFLFLCIDQCFSPPVSEAFPLTLSLPSLPSWKKTGAFAIDCENLSAATQLFFLSQSNFLV